MPTKKKKMRKYLMMILLLAGIAATAFLSGQASQETVLRIAFPCDSYWNIPGEDYYAFFDHAIEVFEEEHPGVQVEYTSGILVEDYPEWLAEQILKGDDPDVMVILPDILDTMSEDGILENLDRNIRGSNPLDTSLFYEAALDFGQVNGIQYGLPLESVPVLMFVNKTLLEKEGQEMPEEGWTWDAFYDLCQRLTKDTDGDGVIDQFGCYDYSWRYAMAANGCFPFSEDGTQCLLTQKNAVEALSFVQSIEALAQGTDISDKDFDEGRVAFRPMLFSEYRAYQPYPWRLKGYSSFEWDCIQMPAGYSGEEYYSLSEELIAMSSRSRHKALAWELIKTICASEECQSMVYSQLRGVSAIKSVTESENTWDVLRQDTPGNSNLSLEILDQVMEEAVAEPHFDNYTQVMNWADQEISEALTSDTNLDLQLRQVQRTLESYLQN